jgi:hypothetical protein
MQKYSLFIFVNCSEQFTNINKLYIVASCWTIIDIYDTKHVKLYLLACIGIMSVFLYESCQSDQMTKRAVRETEERGINLLWLLQVPIHLAVWCYYSLSLVHDRPVYIVCPGLLHMVGETSYRTQVGFIRSTQSLLCVYVFVYLYQRCNNI